jgi:predicted deacylase
MSDVAVTSTVDFERPGKQVGRLQVPRSTNESGWSNLFVPAVCIANGRGPSVLITGGVHGDEPEGQVAALNLARETEPDHVKGRLIILPCMSPDASRAYSRLWPDGANLNRSFPGSATGAPDQQLADYVTRVLLPLTDAVGDLHSGGRSMMCLPWSEMHMVEDRAQRRAMVDAMLAWGTDYHFVYINIAGGGLLVDEAERQGKITIGTELGGGGHTTAAIHRVAAHGLRNFLRHLGVLAGAAETRASRGLPPAVILRAVHADDYVLAPESGLFETLVTLGEEVAAGAPLGRLHVPERPDRPPLDVYAETAGVVCSIRAIAATRQGDCLAVIGQRCGREELLE